MSDAPTASPAAARRAFTEQMRLRVNPHYDHDVEPHENEFAYFNPVTLNNGLVTNANARLTLARSKTDALRVIQGLRHEKRQLERDQDDLEERVLRDHPLSPTEAKSLKTIGAAVARRLETLGLQTEFEARRAQIRAAEDEIERQDAVIKRVDVYLDAEERVSDNVKTALAFVKSERAASGGRAYGA